MPRAIRWLVLSLVSSAFVVTKSTAQDTLSLFTPAPIVPPSALASNPGEALGMRRETVGAISYRALSIEAANTFRARSRAPRNVDVVLPGGRSVACVLSSEVTADGLLVMSGPLAEGGIGNRCELVVSNGQVTGTIDAPSGRYSIRSIEGGSAHAVVEVRTEAFPSEMHAQLSAVEESARAVPTTPPMCDVAPAQGGQPKSFGPIRVLVAYTPEAK